MSPKRKQPAVAEGFLPFRGYRTWYKIVGSGESGNRLPLLLLHGGPGLPSDYLEPLFALATGRRVIVYDQLGCGRSDHPQDRDLWEVDLFVEELTVVRRVLGLDHMHLLGHSWGGMLALEHVLSGAPGLASLILADALASVPAWKVEVRRLIDGLSLEQRTALRSAIDREEYSDPLTQEAISVFGHRHIKGMEASPDCLRRSVEGASQSRVVYETLWGPHEFAPTGHLRDWDVSRRLGEIEIPTLVAGGRHDEMTPETTLTIHRGIPNSEYVLFEESAHLPHLSESARFVQVVDDFLERVEAYL